MHNEIFVMFYSFVIKFILANKFHEGTHEGVLKTLQRLCAVFYWQGMRKRVKEFGRNCEVCQTEKSAYELGRPSTVITSSGTALG